MDVLWASGAVRQWVCVRRLLMFLLEVIAVLTAAESALLEGYYSYQGSGGIMWCCVRQHSVQIKTLRMCVSSDPVIVVTPSSSLLPAGTFCGRVWDGGLCWDETPAGTSVTQNCPDQPDPGPPGERDSCSLNRMWWKKLRMFPAN